jgi:phosphatidylglycerol:prolipoprotein diacylglycerol transferase
MHPRLVDIPLFGLFGRDHVPLHTYGVLLAIAFIAGLWVANRQARRAGLDPARVTDMAVYVLIGGLLGAKLMLVVVEWPFYVRNPRELLSLLQSGGVFYGGLLGALPVAWWYARRHSLEGWRTADVLVPGVAIGQAIGRLGCFSAGCCYGRPTSVPWGVTFRDPYATRAVGTPLDIPLHPTQLYEAGAVFLLLLALLWLAGRRRFPGQVTLVYLFGYAVIRFVIEFYRGDASRGTVLGGWVSTSQFIAILVVLGVAVLYPYLRRKQPPDEPERLEPAPA